MSHHLLETQVKDTNLKKLSQAIESWQRVPYRPMNDGVKSESWSLEEKLKFLRQEKLGRFSLIEVPNFWKRVHPSLEGSTLKTLVHLDYTASAQALGFIERYVLDCMKTYANTHTETSATGKNSTQRFHAAIEVIRSHVGAGNESFVIPCGYGATGAIERMQKILGLYLSPKGQKTIQENLELDLKELMSEKFVVLVGPTEHHSNDVTWQDAALCDFVRIKAIPDGPAQNQVDLDDLRAQLKRFPNHKKIGSFSAASNVTGMCSNLLEIGSILKEHDALFFVDYAASGPYADINMERDGIDAIYLSMHKNIGGSNLGILVSKNKIYDQSAHPSFGGGGTVSAVTPWEYHFHEKIEDREYPGTPAIRQVWQAALSFQLKEWLGIENIEKIDHKYTHRLLDFMGAHPKIQILGNPDPKLRYPIFSFLVKHGQKMLHHTFVAALFNDIFGIQARSGCACAGPFGHELLKIPKSLSDKYLTMILNVLNGFKPGWTRIGLHYTLSEEELDYIFKAINGIAFFGPLYLDQYGFNPYTGEWIHDEAPQGHAELNLSSAINKGFQSNLASIENEENLDLAFKQQWREFLLMTAGKIANVIIDQGEHLSVEKHFDQVTVATLPVLQSFLESFTMDSFTFSKELATSLCPLVVPPGQNPEECQKTIIESLDQLIFKPESNRENYEAFEEIESEVDFFYVPKGKMHPAIDVEHIEKHEPCPVCP